MTTPRLLCVHYPAVSLLALVAAAMLTAPPGGASGGRLDPVPPHAGPALVDDLTTRDIASVPAEWKPMKDSLPVSVIEAGGRRALRLPCNFKGTEIDRASWDRAVKLDLTACRGLRFDLHCADPSPISGFSLYLHSGDGWYAGSFGPGGTRGWHTVTIDKSDFVVEGRPSGWGTIDTIRISAWRGENADTEFHLANLALDGADAPIAIIRGESAGRSSAEEGKSVTMFAKNVAGALDRLALPYVVISDLDVTAARLKGKTIAILPHNPGLPAPVARELAAFLSGGGKILAFYILPLELAEATGIGGGAHVGQSAPGHFASIRRAGDGLPGLPAAVAQASWNIRRTEPVPGRSRVVATWFNSKGESTGEPAIVASSNCVFMSHVLLNDDPVHKRAMLLAMLGHLDGGVWKRAVAGGFDRVGRFGPYRGFADAVAGIRREASGAPAAVAELAEAEALHREAVRSSEQGRYAEALATAERAGERLLLAYCSAQKPRKGEHRAWWCHSAFGVNGLSWDEAVSNLAAHGFTAVLPNMLWGGVAFYESSVLPVSPAVRERGDQIAACVAACRKYGVQCHVWKVNWNMAHNAPRPFAERMRSEGRTQVGYDGAPDPEWLCPSHPANQRLEIDAMVEVATNYDVDGIHFDYIRYPDAAHCFCAGCRERFEAALGAKVNTWPADTRKDPAIRQRWLDFRRTNITAVVAGVHEAVRKAKPGVKISAAVFPNWPSDRNGIGQDWKLWCDRGYLDFVCPMDYTPSAVQFEAWVKRQREWAGRVPCYPGIGLSTWDELDIARLVEMVKITRRLDTGGFTVFNYNTGEAGRIVPLCGRGLTARP